MKFISPEEAVAVIKSGDRIFVHGVAASPRRLRRRLPHMKKAAAKSA